MSSYLLFATLGLSAVASAAPTNPNNTTKQCVELEIPVTISANNIKADVPRIDSNIDAVDWVQFMDTWTVNLADHIVGVLPVSDTFTISAQLCVPVDGDKADILQIATHGVGFDKRYWDSEISPDTYSYVDAALAQGYSILTYDRLGTGKSSKPDAYEVVQLPVHVEILKELTDLGRRGELLQSAMDNDSATARRSICSYKANKVVHVGHSFGTVTTMGLLSTHGEVSDGAIMTGFILHNSLMNGTRQAAFGWEFAPQHDPARFGDRSSGYIVQSTESNVQTIFFKKGSFEPELLQYAEEIKQSATVGEFVSSGAFFGQPAEKFKGPVQFFLAEYDFGTCSGDCKGIYDEDSLPLLYPAAADRSVYLQPGTGHGLTLSENATAGYDVIFSYLDEFEL